MERLSTFVAIALLTALPFSSSVPAYAADGAHWGDIVALYTDSWPSFWDPVITVAPQGDVYVAFSKLVYGNYSSWVAWYEPGAGWHRPRELDTGGHTTYVTHAASDGAGQITLLLQGSDLGGHIPARGERTILVAQGFHNDGWRKAAVLETNSSGNIYDASLAVGDDGEALAIWVQGNSTATSVVSAAISPGGGQNSPSILATYPNASARYPRIAMASAGGAISTWVVSNGSNSTVTASAYARGQGWEMPRILAARDGASESVAQVGADGAGNFLAAWVERPASNWSIVTTRRTIESNWSATSYLNRSESVAAPALNGLATGGFLLLWPDLENIPGGFFVAPVRPGHPPDSPTRQGTTGQLPRAMVAAADPGGNVSVVWEEYVGFARRVAMSHRVAAQPWEPAAFASPAPADEFDSAYRPTVTMDAFGNTWVAWISDPLDSASVVVRPYIVSGGVASRWTEQDRVEPSTPAPGNEALLGAGVAAALVGVAVVIWRWRSKAIRQRRPESRDALGGLPAAWPPDGGPETVWPSGSTAAASSDLRWPYPPGYPPPYPPGEPGQPTQAAKPPSMIAPWLWGLGAVRDLIFLWWVTRPNYALGQMILGQPDFGLLALLFPLIGIAGCVMAAAFALGHAPREIGFLGAALGVVGSSFPGVFIIGLVGMVLTFAALIALAVTNPHGFVRGPR